jgi:hypothetical protein
MIKKGLDNLTLLALFLINKLCQSSFQNILKQQLGKVKKQKSI